jgi:cell division protein FtsQ
MPRLSSLAGAALLTLVALAFLLVLFAANGPVRVVRVMGDLTPAERREVRDAVVGGLEDRMLALDLDGIVARVSALSWPHEVRVRRLFPDGVAVQVSKEVFVARWGGGGVLNSEGRVITTPDREVSALPLLDCARADGARAMQVYRTLVGLLAGRGMRVTALRENGIGEWSVDLASGVTVALGRDDTIARLERFLAVWESVLSRRVDEIVSVDARYSNGIAVSWRDVDHPVRDPVQLAALDRAPATKQVED